MSKGMLGMIPLPDALALVSDLCTKLAGEDGAAWLAELKRFLRKEPTWAPGAPVALAPVTLPRWRTVRLGVYKTAEAYAAAIKAKGMKIGAYARQILAEMPIAAEEYELELFLGSARDFGFTRNTPRRQIFDRAAQHGYYPCPAETGPAAREQYVDQPKDQCRVVAMEPIADDGGALKVFRLVHSAGGVWLDSGFGRPDDEWSPDSVWVWFRRKPQQ